MDQVFELLERGAVVLTPGRRLAREIRHRYTSFKQDSGVAVWATPQVLPWQPWLELLWQRAAVKDLRARLPMVLSRAQQHYLWEQTSGEQMRETLHSDVAIRAAREAWSLMHAWRIPWPARDDWVPDQFRHFVTWSERFATAYRDHDLLDPACLPDTLAEQLRRGLIRGPSLLVLASFEGITPQQQSLIDVLEATGTVVQRWWARREEPRSRRVRCTDPSGELELAARWVRARLLEADGRPLPRIGVIIPDLDRLRSRVAQVFTDVLAPAAVLPAGVGGHGLAFNLALGSRLVDVPLIDTALGVLELTRGRSAHDQVSKLLRSPFLRGGLREASRRALLDAELRRANLFEVDLGDLRYFAGDDEQSKRAWACPELVNLLERLTGFAGTRRERHFSSTWIDRFGAILDAVGWPGDRVLSSSDYQAAQRWRRLLGEFTRLDAVAGRMRFTEALTRIRRMATETVFQPESPPNAVNIMGVLEANGLSFDHLWLSGVHDEDWPPLPTPNPLIPLQLQREYGLPESSAERSLEQTQRTLTNLMASAREVVVSWPGQIEDRAMRPSPLIRNLPEVLADSVGYDGVPLLRDQLFATRALEVFRDDRAPPLRPGSLATGGASVLKWQAACPFRAFSQSRLGAEPLDEPVIGIDPRTRGWLAHEALRALWEDLRNQETLLKLDDFEIRRHVDEAIAAASRSRHRVRGRLGELERRRLTDLIIGLLEVERVRKPFLVEGCEVRREIVLGPLRLGIRIDRVDTVTDGGRVISDYKTADVRPARWSGERPDEPQLPLYAIAFSEEAAAILFGILRAERTEFAGLSREHGLLPESQAVKYINDSQWHRQIDEWRSVLTALAIEFGDGDARVDPKRGACEYCHLTHLCRITEAEEAG